jgi:HIRAN domain
VNNDRLRLWMERSERGSGFYLRDAATGEPVRWEDPRIRVVHVAGISYREEAAADASFDPGRRLALVPEPQNEHDPNAVGIWNEERTLQAGYVPAAVAPELAGDEQAVSLWRYEGSWENLPVPPDPLHWSAPRTGRFAAGLRVLIAPADAWIGTPR